MFYWMNRRLYHFLKKFMTISATLIAVISLIFLFIHIGLKISAIWGSTAFGIYLILSTIATISSIVGWIESERPYKKELEEQERVERALKRDW